MEISDLYKEFLLSSGVSIDTRTIQPNQIFFALPGEKTDGNAFAKRALENGARMAIVSDVTLAEKNRKCIFYKDTLSTLQLLATFHRTNLNIPIIGITGSVAKTTTKELIGTVLQIKFKTFFTPGNLNNHIGVPLTILSIRPDIELAVIEMGANHIGEIQELCNIAKPTHGLITRIGKAHLEGFGSVEGVIVAKSDLYRYLRDHHGIAFINDGDPILKALQQGFDMKKINIHDKIISKIINSNPFLDLKIKFGMEEFEMHTQIPGIYNLENIEAAMVIGQYFGVGGKEMTKAIEAYKPTSNRSELLKYGTNEYLMDAYNANPTSMIEAIKSFVAYPTINQKWLVIGEMKEMGVSRIDVHKEVMEYLKKIEQNVHLICLIGPTFMELNTNKNWQVFENVLEAKKWMDLQIIANTSMLIKGSRSMTLEKLVDEVKSDLVHE